MKRLANSHSTDPFCRHNDIVLPDHIAVWCNAKTAGSARVNYHIPVKFLTLARLHKKGQECFIMNGEYQGGICTITKCNTKIMLST